MVEKKSIYLAGNALEESPHVYAFFNTRGEEYRMLLPSPHENPFYTPPEDFLQELQQRASSNV